MSRIWQGLFSSKNNSDDYRELRPCSSQSKAEKVPQSRVEEAKDRLAGAGSARFVSGVKKSQTKTAQSSSDMDDLEQSLLGGPSKK